jgi:cob(I)alamin adenosyltransferase
LREEKGALKEMSGKGLLMVNTGNGKGKTTAALGLAFRAMGHGMPVCVFHFIKKTGNYGELTAAGRFDDLMEIHVVGEGFTWESEDLNKDRQAALNGWDLAKSRIEEGRHRLIILDEFTYALNYGMVDEDDALRCIANRPDNMHVVVTGRDAPQKLIQIADLVSEVMEVKHPFRKGVKAQKGIEW